MLWSSAAGPLLLLAAEASAEAAASGDTGYSQNSYNATLFLFVLCFPGLYSLVKRSAKSKVRDEKGVAVRRQRLLSPRVDTHAASPCSPFSRWSARRLRCPAPGL